MTLLHQPTSLSYLQKVRGSATDQRYRVKERPALTEDYLVVRTGHSSKGLEWEMVHLIAAYDGNFPADMTIGTEDGIEVSVDALFA